MEKLFWPDLFIVGGGISKDHEKFLPLSDRQTYRLFTAQLLTEAGIIRAAMAAQRVSLSYGICTPSFSHSQIPYIFGFDIRVISHASV